MSKGTGVQPFLAGAVVAKKYRLLRSLGEGAMGVVWHARNELTGGEVALKLIVRPERELRARLLDEAKACCAIRHRNVVQVHDVGETDSGDPFLVMELLAGETLADVLARRRRLDVGQAAAIGRDVANALAAAHEKGIVHRDLKPANIFLHHAPGEPVPVVKVLDFGVSKNLVGPSVARTVAGTTVGSPLYMSPEQALADAAVDGRTDVWSLGAVLFEMLAGVRPFEGDGMEVLQKVVHGPIPLLWQKVRRVPPELSGLVTACLRRAREQRPWPASEIASRLDRFAAVSPGSPPPVIAMEPPQDSGAVRPTLPGATQVNGGTVRLTPEILVASPPPRAAAPLPVQAVVLPADMASPVPSGARGEAGVRAADSDAPGNLSARFPRKTKRIVAIVVAAVAAVLAVAVTHDVLVSRRKVRGEEGVPPEGSSAPGPGGSLGLDALKARQITGVVPPAEEARDAGASSPPAEEARDAGASSPPAEEARDASAATPPAMKLCNRCGKFDRIKVNCCPRYAPRRP